MSDQKKTRLAAIMFTDIVGYSSLMEADEKNAMAVIEEHNRILLPLIDSFNGRTVDAIGDGLLVVFDSVFEACNCALTIQNAVAGYDKTVEAERGFLLRISVHMGDIWYEGDRVYGNGVNICSRLLPLAPPGGICISDDVQRQLKNKTDARFELLGSRNLKNISRPVVCYRLVTGHEQPEPRGESADTTDAVRKEIQAQLEKIREKRISYDPGDTEGKKPELESKLERRILGFVENVMDKALEKWENIPPERREQLVNNLKKEEWYSGAGLNISLDSKKKHRRKADGGDDAHDDHRELIPVGIVATAGFGTALIWTGAIWLLFPLVFIGLMPLGIGISHFITGRRRLRAEQAALPERYEKLVLEAANRRGGRLSVMQLAAESGISLDKAERCLDDMAKKGYIGQEIDENGLITYVFPGFLDGTDDTPLLK